MFYVLNGRTNETEPSLCLKLNHSFYLFNTPPGTKKKLEDFDIFSDSILCICETSNKASFFDGIYRCTSLDHNYQLPLIKLIVPPSAQGLFLTDCSIFHQTLTPKFPTSYQTKNLIIESIPLISTICIDLQINNTFTVLIISPDSLEEFDLFKSKIQIDKYNIIFHFTEEFLIQEESYRSFFQNSKNYFFPYCSDFGFPKSVSYYNRIALGNNLPPISPRPTSKPLSYANFISLFPNDQLSLNSNEISISKYQSSVCNSNSLLFPNQPDLSLPRTSLLAFTALGRQASSVFPKNNDSGYLITDPQGISILLDPGECSAIAIKTRFGQNADEVFRSIKAIWISHSHCDHTLGLRMLLSEINKHDSSSQPFLLCPTIIQKWASLFQIPIQFYSRKKPFQIGDMEIQSFDVDHSEESMGCVITNLKNHTKFVFSGDKSDKQSIVEQCPLASNCTLLLHESTYPHDSRKAIKFKHSTLLNAINEKSNLKAEYLLLTHFSKKYSQSLYNTNEENIAKTFDFLSFSFEEIGTIIPKLD